MVRLISLLKRKSGLSHDEFLAYWHDNHGPLIAASSAAGYVRRYTQHPRAAGLGDDTWDGVTIQEFDSVDAFHAHMGEPDFGAMMDDLEQFLDTSQIQYVVCDEPTVVLGNDTTGE
jgi:uncharacterized protein (TIGR02118 family)